MAIHIKRHFFFCYPSELRDHQRPCDWCYLHWLLALFNPCVSHIHHHPPPSSYHPAGARDLVRIFNNVSTSTDVCLTRILRHPLNKILLPPIFFTESFAITPTTLALLGSQVGTVCICLFQNDLKRKLAKMLPGQSDQTSLKPLDVK